MKIGIVCYPTVGGSGVLATELGHQLALRGHEVHFITYEIPFRLQLENENVFFHEVEINQYELFKYPDYALTLAVKMVNVAQHFGLDILHVHYAIPHATSAYLAKQILGTKKPAVITTLHGTDITLVGRHHAYFQMVKFSIENSCGVTAVSQNLRDQTQEYFQIKKDIQVIYNFFTPRPELINKPMRHPYVKEDEKLIIHSSNYRPVKHPEDVIRIFQEIHKKIKCKLLLIGTGGGMEDILKMIADLNLKNEVFFLGKNRDVDPYIASGDLFLLPSAQESFGLAALEAMAYGVPCVASNAGGLPELIQHGKNGFLAPIGDVTAMANYSIELLSNPTLYAQISTAAKVTAHEKFSPDVIIPQYEAYYQRCLTQ